MPQEPVLVVNIETGDATYMHSIDASDAIRLGDYRPVAPDDKSVSPEQRAAALNRMRGMNVNPPPEMQTKEERDETRRLANEEAARQAGTAVQEPMGVRRALGAETTPPPAPTPAPAATPEASRAGRRGSD